MNLQDIAIMLDPFADERGVVFIHLPIDDGTLECPTEEVPLHSENARAWVKGVLYGMYGKLPSEQQTRTALDIIKARALERPRREATREHEEVKLSALAQVIIKISDEGGLRATPTRLLQKLNTVAHRMDLLGQDPDWPRSENSLGKLLSSLIPVLERRGVKLERHPNDRPREWSIHPLGELRQPPKETSDTTGDIKVMDEAGIEKTVITTLAESGGEGPVTQSYQRRSDARVEEVSAEKAEPEKS